MQDSGKPEDAGTAEPEGAGTEATRETISRRRGRECSGRPGHLNPRQSRKVQDAGKLATTPGGAAGEQCRGETQGMSTRGAEGREIRGNSKIRRRRSRKMQKPGQPGDSSAGTVGGAKLRRKLQAPAPDVLKDARIEATRGSIAGKAGRCRRRGNLATHRQAQLEEQSLGATRSLSARCVEGCEIRGSSKIHRRQSLKMQDAGQLATSSGGATGRAEPRGLSAGRAEGCENRGDSKLHRGRSLRDADSGATRRLSARLNGLMHGPGNL